MKLPYQTMPLRIVAYYALFAGLWILFSDRLLRFIVTDPERLTDLQTAKGGLFVAVTALLLHVVIRRFVEEVNRKEELLKERNEELCMVEEELRQQLDESELSHHELRESEENYRLLSAELEKRVRERTAALERANREMESFSYSVSHDLRAPLRHIDGFSRALLEDCAGQLDLQGKGYLTRICAAANRMGQLIDDLLQLASVSRSDLQRRSVSLSLLARTIAAELAGTDPERDVSFTIAEGVKGDGDPLLLRIVLENLLGNAWKYTGKKPRAVIEFGAVEGEEGRAFYVRDNGVGFDMAYVDKLFNPFQRLHAMDEFEGTGIGLATVRRVVERHGGRVWAEGMLGTGATIYFTLGETQPPADGDEG
ncbi:ATP-binding protein [Geobacter sp.]|uniref:sensor histidine kinase n=1 Tax=Geobacter sp. TaxID=46610 RepID=UPI0027BAE7F6|nr:ATP-binding protein [Geobacter sp.]